MESDKKEKKKGGCTGLALAFGIYFIMISPLSPIMEYEDTYWDGTVPTATSFLLSVVFTILYWSTVVYLMKK